MVKTREHKRKTCYPHSDTLLSSQISLYHLDGTTKSLFAHSNPTQQPIWKQEHWESGFTHYHLLFHLTEYQPRACQTHCSIGTHRHTEKLQYVPGPFWNCAPQTQKHRGDEEHRSQEKKIPFAATFWSSQWFSCFSRWSHCSIHHGLQTRPVQPVQREKNLPALRTFSKESLAVSRQVCVT